MKRSYRRARKTFKKRTPYKKASRMMRLYRRPKSDGIISLKCHSDTMVTY